MKETRRREILEEIDLLDHSAEYGFYDEELDMEFRYLRDWLKFKYGVTFKEVL